MKSILKFLFWNPCNIAINSKLSTLTTQCAMALLLTRHIDQPSTTLQVSFEVSKQFLLIFDLQVFQYADFIKQHYFTFGDFVSTSL